MSFQQEPYMEFQDFEFQDFEEDSGFESAAVTRLAMLRLNNTTVDHHTTTRAPQPSTERCTLCGSQKRRSPSSPSLNEPTSKSITRHPSVAAGDHRLRGFTKISLPVTPPITSTPSSSNSKPLLLRCISDPINSPGINQIGAPNPQFSAPSTNSAHSLNPQTPENVKINVPAATSPSPTKPTSLSPLPPILHRSLSDLTSSAYQVETTTPPRPSAARKLIPTPSSGDTMGQDSFKGESPNAKRLKRMKDRMKEMSQWWDEVMSEDVEEAALEDNTPKDGSETEILEVARAERTGECLTIHFKCPCGKSYQILLSGRNCYYMLMPFEQDDSETETEETLSVERNGKWLEIRTKCPCAKGYQILVSGKDCYYKLVYFEQ